ncbi:MAG: type II secretion system secretin GspD [Pseudomonadota bacterium]
MRYDKNKIVARWMVLIALLALPIAAHGQPTSGAPAATTQGGVRLPTPQPAPPPAAVPTPAPAKEAKGGDEAAGGEAREKENGQAAAGEIPGNSDMVYLNVQDQEIKDVIKQISKATAKNFIIDDKVRGKVTIMSEKTMTKEEAYQAFLSALEVVGFTTVIGPGGIIKIVALKDAVTAPIPIHVDSTPYTDSYVTRLIALRNISALEMSNAIKGLISKSGNMFAYPATNTLIITDSGTNIDRLMKIIKELDQEGPQQVLEIIPVNYADAKDVAAKVLQLFELDKTGQAKAARPGGGAELEEIKDVSKIIADERTNSLIVLASKRAIDKVRGIIAKLDIPLQVGDTGSIHVHYLKYANAAAMAQTLAAIASGKAAPPAAKPAAAGEKGKTSATPAPTAVAQLEGGVTIGADETTNALIITASAKDYQILVDELISKLDIPRRQVYLEAIVMELSVTKGQTAGVSGFGGGGNNSVIGFGNSGSSEFNVLQGLFNPASFFSTPGLLGGLLSKQSVTIDVPKSGGGTTAVTIPAFAAFLNLLQTYRDANIVSTPNIMTLDNQKASIEVTQTQYANSTTTVGTAGAVTTSPIPLEAGLTLEITPQITEGDAVRLEIHHKLSNFTGAPNASGAAPQTKREITTTVVAMDGQTVVLGGLMQDITTHQKSKVPILGDIPLIGLLFRSSTSTNDKSNLLVFITPHVIKDPSDFAEISKVKIEQRNTFIDKNYGKRQQQSIKDTIATHRADLLEFTPSIAYTKGSSTMPPVTAAPPAPLAAAMPAPSPPAPAAKPPVISISPVDANAPPEAAAPKSPKVKSKAKAAAPKPDQKAPSAPGTKDSGEIDTAY